MRERERKNSVLPRMWTIMPIIIQVITTLHVIENVQIMNNEKINTSDQIPRSHAAMTVDPGVTSLRHTYARTYVHACT